MSFVARARTTARHAAASVLPKGLRRSWVHARRRLDRAVAGRSGDLLVCSDIARWASEHGVERRMISPAWEATRALPRTVEPSILDEYLTRVGTSARERNLVPVPGARLVGRAGLVVLPDGAVASESIYRQPVLAMEPDYHSLRRRPRVAMPGDYFSLLVGYARGGVYYHWVHDTLEQLYGVVDALPPGARFIVPADLLPYQQETLRAVGIQDHQVVPFSGDHVWEIETLHFAPPVVSSGANLPAADAWLRERFYGHYGIEAGTGTRRLFLSRRAQVRRRVANEADVEAFLAPFGFETVVPEALPIAEQLAIFADAEVVVSTHGSAFTNLLFSPPGCTVVDIIEPSMAQYAYVFWSLTEQNDQTYWYVLAEPVPRDGHPSDTQVPIDKLAATFEQMGLAP